MQQMQAMRGCSTQLPLRVGEPLLDILAAACTARGVRSQRDVDQVTNLRPLSVLSAPLGPALCPVLARPAAWKAMGGGSSQGASLRRPPQAALTRPPACRTSALGAVPA